MAAPTVRPLWLMLLKPLTIALRVRFSDGDPGQIRELAQSLRDAILATDVDDVRPGTAGAAPAGAKSGELPAIGALVVNLAPAVVPSLMAVVASWLSRQPSDVEIEVDGQRFQGQVTRSQRDELVAAYLRRLDPGS